MGSVLIERMPLYHWESVQIYHVRLVSSKERTAIQVSLNELLYLWNTFISLVNRFFICAVSFPSEEKDIVGSEAIHFLHLQSLSSCLYWIFAEQLESLILSIFVGKLHYNL